MSTRQEILATTNATTRETGYERVLAVDLLETGGSGQTGGVDGAGVAVLG